MNLRSLLALAVVGLGALAGCDDSVRFRLRLEWQRGGAQACPTTTDGRYSCTALPLSCDVRVRVRIINTSDGQPHYSECFTIQNNADACLLADLPISPQPVPNEMVRVQVIVWTVEELVRSGIDLTGTDGCPATTEFAAGFPKLVGNPTEPENVPVPALGGETYFAVGDSPVATVTLGCARWDTLDAPSCQASAIPLEATIRDPRTFGSVLRMQASDMEVRFGEPVANGDGTYRVDLGPSFFTPALSYTPSGTLLWQGTLTDPPTGRRCLRVAAQGVAAPTIACFEVPVGSPVRADGFLVGRVMLRDLLDLRMLSDLPEEGMVLGVVIDAAGQPVRGAVVSTTGATVVYPDDNLQTVGFAATDSRGYFLSTDAAFDSTWRATAGGLMSDGSTRGGLVDDHVTVVVVRLDGVVPVLDAGLGGMDPDAGVDAP